MKLSPIIKILIVTVLSFALFGLFIQFVFSFLNQSEYGPKLTIVNFAAPFILTIGIILFFIQRMFSKTGLEIFASTSNKLRIPLFFLLTILLVWQMRYVVLYYGIKQTSDKVGLVSELLPMVAGFFITFIIFMSMLKRSTSANMGFAKVGL